MAVEDNGPTIVGVTWFLCFFSGGFLGLRVYAKLSRRHDLWWDDYVLIAAWVLLLAESIVTQVGQNLGFGKHTYDIPIPNLATIALCTSIGASISCFAATFSKISFGITLLRLTDGPWKWFVWFTIVTLFLTMLPSAMLTWLQCTPSAKAWNSTLEGTCWNPSIVVNYGIFNAAWCTWIDFALALLPWKVIWHLQLKTREKIGVGIAMSLGILSGICAIVKGIYMVQLREEDFFFNGIDVTIWTATETAAAIIAASIPVLRVFFKEAVSTQNYKYGSRSKSHDVRLSSYSKKGPRFGNGTLVDANVPEKPSAWRSLGPKEDHASDKSFARDEIIESRSPSSIGILQTSTVVVDYDTRSSLGSPRDLPKNVAH